MRAKKLKDAQKSMSPPIRRYHPPNQIDKLSQIYSVPEEHEEEEISFYREERMTLK